MESSKLESSRMELIEDIIETVETFDKDEYQELFKEIFYFLSKSNTLENYSYTKTNILFKMNGFEETTLQNLKELVSNFKLSKEKTFLQNLQETTKTKAKPKTKTIKKI